MHINRNVYIIIKVNKWDCNKTKIEKNQQIDR